MKLRQLFAHMKAAYVYAELSYHMRRQVGCVIVKNDTIISIGYNGTPPGEDNNCEDEHGATLPTVIHAEDNAIRKLEQANVCPDQSVVLFVTTAPCIKCANRIFKFGIKHVIYDDVYRNNDGVEFLQERDVRVESMDSYNFKSV